MSRNSMVLYPPNMRGEGRFEPCRGANPNTELTMNDPIMMYHELVENVKANLLSTYIGCGWGDGSGSGSCRGNGYGHGKCAESDFGAGYGSGFAHSAGQNNCTGH